MIFIYMGEDDYFEVQVVETPKDERKGVTAQPRPALDESDAKNSSNPLKRVYSLRLFQSAMKGG